VRGVGCEQSDGSSDMSDRGRSRRRRLHTWSAVLRCRPGHSRLKAYRRRHTLALKPRPWLVARGSVGLVITGIFVVAAFPLARFSTAATSLGVVQSFGGANPSVGSTIAVSPTTATAQGDLLVATIKDRALGGSESVTGITDSSGNTWTVANRLTQGSQASLEVWYAPSAASVGTDGSVTVALSGVAAIAVTVLEISGSSSTPLDNVVGAGDASPAASTGTALAKPQDIVIADVGWNADATPNNQTQGFTTTSVEQSTAAGSMTGEQAAWEVAGNTEAQSYGALLSESVVWTATMVIFDAAGGTAPSPTPSATPSATATPAPTPTPTVSPTPTASPTPTVSPTPTDSPTPTPTPTATPSPTPSQTRHVMVIMEENKGYAATLGSCSDDPYLCSLASQNASYTNWYGVSHPSLPNYLAIDSGSTQGQSSDCTSCGPFSAPDLGGQLSAKGIPWTAYMESMPSACYTGGSSGDYGKKHNPFVYFTDVLNNACAAHDVPYPGASGLISALDGAAAPSFVWITPNALHDMHDGTVQQGDAWLTANLAPVLASPWFRNYNATVIVTMDENNSQSSPAGGQVPMVVISSNAAGQGTISSSGNLYGTLRAIEEAFGLGYLGAAADPSNGDPIGSF
jgi:phosphatidylinositol-3-phosphatase